MKYINKLKYLIPILFCSIIFLSQYDKVKAVDHSGYGYSTYEYNEPVNFSYLGGEMATYFSIGSCDNGKNQPSNGYVGWNIGCYYTITIDDSKLTSNKYSKTREACPDDSCYVGHVGSNYRTTATKTFYYKNAGNVSDLAVYEVKVSYGFTTDATSPTASKLTYYSGGDSSSPATIFLTKSQTSNNTDGMAQQQVVKYHGEIQACKNDTTDVYYKSLCTDGGSGCNNNEAILKISGSTSSSSTEFRDQAGNITYISVDKEFDTTPLSSTSFGTSVNTGWSNKKTVSAYCNEEGCSCTLSKTTFTSNGSGTLTCYDKCGNVNTKTYTVSKIDTTAPACGSQTSPSKEVYLRGTFLATVKCKETSDGISISGCLNNKTTFTETKTAAKGNVTIKDNAGNTKSCPYEAKLDNEKPTVEFEYDTNKYGTGTITTNDKQVDITIKAYDEDSKPQYICYKIISETDMGMSDYRCRKVGKSDVITSSSTGQTIRTSFTFKKEGKYQLVAYAIDGAKTMDLNTGKYKSEKDGGNKSKSIVKTIYIDRTPPQDCGVEIPKPWMTQKKVTKYCKDEDCKTVTITQETYTQNGTGTVTCTDKAGNRISHQYTVIKVDSVAPKCGDQLEPNNKYYYNDKFLATVECNEKTDGVSISGCRKTKFTEQKTSSKGHITIQDVAGNIASCPYTANIDKTKPTTTIELVGDYENMESTRRTSNKTVDVMIKSVDTQSKPRFICYKIVHSSEKASNIEYTCEGLGDGSKIELSQSEQTAKLTVQVGKDKNGKYKDGTYTVYAYSIDQTRKIDLDTGEVNHNRNSGNKSDVISKKVYIDTEAPEVTFSYIAGDKWKNKVTPVTVKAKDLNSGIGTFEWFWSKDSNKSFETSTVIGEVYKSTYEKYGDGTKTRTLTHPSSIDYNGTLYLYVRVCDRAFPNPNCTEYKSDKGIKFDNVAPEIEYVTPASTKTTTGQKDDEAPWSNDISVTVRAIDTVFLTDDKYTPYKYNELTDEQKSKIDSKMSSGLNNIYLYWDTNDYHKDTDLTLNTSTFSDSASIYNKYLNVNFKAYYNWKLNFSSYQSREEDGIYTSVESATEGVRYFKVRVTDNANNTSEFYAAGPYKYDITNPIVKGEDFTGQSGYFISAEDQIEEYENMKE